MLLDSHCHLNLAPLTHEEAEVLQSHVDMQMVCVGINKETSEYAAKLAAQNQNIFATVGIHPSDICDGKDISFIDELINQSRVIGIGECGFDFFRDEKSTVIADQEQVFRAQIEQSLKYNKPLMIHTRSTKFTLDAYEETLRVFADYTSDSRWKGAQIHFYVGNKNYAQRFLDCGCMLSFTGVVTLTAEFDEVLKYVPLDRMLFETDAPFVSPKKYRGQTCYPKYVEEVYRHIAEVKGIPQESLEEIILQNFNRFYKIT
ncbi:MAG TPA: TatD family hydrolase [Candidatus Paceibacterota bacterium]